MLDLLSNPNHTSDSLITIPCSHSFHYCCFFDLVINELESKWHFHLVYGLLLSKTQQFYTLRGTEQLWTVRTSERPLRLRDRASQRYSECLAVLYHPGLPVPLHAQPLESPSKNRLGSRIKHPGVHNQEILQDHGYPPLPSWGQDRLCLETDPPSYSSRHDSLGRLLRTDMDCYPIPEPTLSSI